jgi:hypothetical protein
LVRFFSLVGKSTLAEEEAGGVLVEEVAAVEGEAAPASSGFWVLVA